MLLYPTQQITDDHISIRFIVASRLLPCCECEIKETANWQAWLPRKHHWWIVLTKPTCAQIRSKDGIFFKASINQTSSHISRAFQRCKPGCKHAALRPASRRFVLLRFAFLCGPAANPEALVSILESIESMSKHDAEQEVDKKCCNSAEMAAFPVCRWCFYRKPLGKSRVLKWFFSFFFFPDNLTGSPDTVNDYADNLTALPINISYYSHCQRENKNMTWRSTLDWQMH